MKHLITKNYCGCGGMLSFISRTGLIPALIFLAAVLPAKADYVPVALSGFNHDVVANGVGPARSSVSSDVDGVNYAFVAPDFRASTGSAAPSRYLPANGLINSAATGGLTYQLADYSDSNALRVAVTGTSDTLFFVTPRSAGEVFILVTSGSGVSKANFRVNFTDNSSAAFNGIRLSDWYGGANFAIQGIGRVNLTNNGLEGNATDPRLYEVKLGLNNTQLSKTIQSIIVEKDSGAGIIVVMGISINNATCYAPSGFSADNLGADTADLKWTLPTLGTPAGFEWRVVPGGSAVSAAAVDSGMTTGTANRVGLSFLASSTAYTAFIRTICGMATGDTTAWSAPLNFSTTQIPVTVFPWTEGFEGGTVEWTLENGTQVNKWVVDTAAKNGGARGLYISNTNGVSNNYAVSGTGVTTRVHAWRDISFPSGFPIISVSFDWKSRGENNYDYMKVWVVPVSYNPSAGAEITSGTGRTQLGSNFQNTTSYATATYAIPSSYEGTTARLVFEWRNDGSGGTQPPAALDNIGIVVSDCAPPAGLTAANITYDSADIIWTPSGSAALWQLEWGETGFTQGTGTRIMSTGAPAGLKLQDNKSYSVYIRSACSATDSSAWVGPYTFRTLMLPCAGKPDAGVLSANMAFACSTESIVLTAQGVTAASGLTYEWQSSPAGAGTWTSMSAVADTARTLTGQTIATDYRLIISCTPSGESDTSNTVTVGSRACYCKPSFSAGCSSWRVSNVTYGTINNTSSTCGTSDFTHLSTQQTAGVPATMTVTISAWTGWGVYMDFNNDGDFDDPGEWLFGKYADLPNTANVTSAPITIPGYIPPGRYRMRVMIVWGWGPGAGEACMTRSAAGGGNFHDYTVEVLNNASCYPPVNVSVSNIQAYSADLQWDAPPLTSPGGYEWRIVSSGDPVTAKAVDSGGTAGRTSTTSVLAANTAYSLYVRSGCGSASSDSSLWSAPVDFTTLMAPCAGKPGALMITTIILPPGICSGGTAALDAIDTTTVLTSGIDHQWQYANSSSGPWSNVIGGTGATTINYITEGLADTTWFRVKTTCTYSGDSVFSASTMVPVKEYALPYRENFDTIANDKVPGCFVKNSANGSWSVRNDYRSADGTGLTAIRLDFPSGSTSLYPSKNAFFTIPALNLQAGGAYSISFKYCRGRQNSTANTGNVYPENLKLYINRNAPGTNVADVTSGTVLFDYVIEADSVQDTLIIFRPAVSGAHYFSWYSNTPSPGSYVTGGTVAVDDIGITDCSVLIQTQPQPVYSCLGGSAALSVGAAGPGLSYQWRKDGRDIPGATGTGYQISGVSAADAGNYSVLISGKCQDVYSDTVALQIIPVPVAGIKTSGPLEFCEGDSLLLQANTAPGQSYQWLQDGKVQTGATADELAVRSAGNYQVIVTVGGACSDTSAAVSVRVNPLPKPVISQNGDMLNAGSGYSAYQWFYDDILITGAADSLYRPVKDGKYSVMVTDGKGCSTKVGLEFRLGVTAPEWAGNIRIYPNPAGNIVFIDAPAEVNVSIHAVDGKLIGRQTRVRHIDISQLADGMYNLYISNTDNVPLKVEKLVKQTR